MPPSGDQLGQSVHAQRQENFKSCSTLECTVRRSKTDRSFVAANERLRDPEPQTRAPQLLGCKEWIEDTVLNLQRYTGAAIVNGDAISTPS